MSDQLAKVRAYYKSTNFDYEHFWSGDAMALHFGYYDSRQTTHQQSLLRMNEVLAELASIDSNDSVLDAGCGYGGSSIWLAEAIGCRATGITVVPYQVERAKRRAAVSKAASRLHFIEGDYAHSELAAESFDVVWGLESIVHCDDKPGFINEAYRLLKPGGRLIIAEYLLRDDPALTLLQHDKMKPFLDGWMMPSLLSPDQYRRAAVKAGFTSITTHDLSAAVEPSLKLCRRNAALAMPLVGTLKRLGLIDTIRRNYTIANYVLYDLFREGLWQYQVVVATKPRTGVI